MAFGSWVERWQYRPLRQNTVLVSSLVYYGETARILSFLPVPSISHDVVFKAIHEELLRRGHEIVVVTAGPLYNNLQAPDNLTEIDIHNVSYSLARQRGITSITKKETDPSENLRRFLKFTADTFAKQIQTPGVQKLLTHKSRYFDLIFLDASSRISIVLSHVFSAPVIAVCPTGSIERHNHIAGVPSHPILYPQILRTRLYDLTMWEKTKELLTEIIIQKITKDTEEHDNRVLKHLFGPKTPAIAELNKNIDMFFYGGVPIWEDNRPVPPNVIYIGGINKVSEKPLPQDIKQFLDKSPVNVIYVSFGSNFDTLDFPVKTFETLTKVFSNIPYNIFWKWDSEDFPISSSNIRTFNWLPQVDFLRHPKVKLFLTQAGLRSTEDAIEAGVPLIGIPVFMDQFSNAEKYVRHGIGIKLDKDTLTEIQLTESINMIMTYKSYKQNVIKLRNVINDQPMSALERAAWWAEHVIRHGGARHLKTPAAGMNWPEYYELNLLLAVLFCVLSAIKVVILCIHVSIKLIFKKNKLKEKVF
ncbi:UDP-glucosyltransferase 2-like [Leguminivora glycinivorella]|uniref:UDP-glucosyltransferase 2-like n=1 Tax=Leguminivora glycinivorella TaxID=1035111 RepID=UPI00200F8D6C|nr:UDP-glucosyltransferase 2-like [Leguminivora glycinivorella]